MPSPFPEELFADLNVAFNEAEFHDVAVRPDIAEAMVVLRMLSLPEVGPEPPLEDRVVKLRLTKVGRVCASLRLGRWDDDQAIVESFSLESLSEACRSFEAQPIYGWDFFDPDEDSWAHWRNRLSLDVSISGGSTAHVLDLFQESASGPPRHLDVRIWFNGMAAYGLDNTPRQLVEIAASGRRWWDGLYAGDPRTQGHGIVRAGPLSQPPEP